MLDHKSNIVREKQRVRKRLTEYKTKGTQEKQRNTEADLEDKEEQSILGSDKEGQREKLKKYR